jgi:hypothetical protein
MPNSLEITPPPSPISSVPDTGMPKLDNLDTAQHRMDISSLGASSDEYAKSLGDNKQTITDLINDVTALQAQGEGLLKDYGGVPNAPSPGGFNPEKGYQDLAEKLNPSKKSLQATNTPMNLGSTEDFDRYKGSKDFQTFGYTPNLGEEQEFKYGRAMTWGDTVARAWGGGKELAANTFIEGWKGWGRMASALFTWDASKLMGSEEERYKMAEEQNAIMNKYAIYDTETSKEGSLWNRQFFGNMLQQSGFAVGAGLQFATEEFLTAGLGTAFEAAAGGLMMARTAKNLEKASELSNATREVMGTITSQPKVENALLNGVKTLLPGVKTVEEFSKLYKAGAGYAQLGFTGLGGIRRGLSEFNMSRSESIFEAASTYKQLEDRLVNDYTREHGAPPQGDDLERIRQSAEDASHDNFMTNLGILSVMNRFQFDTMTKQFSKARRLVNVGEAELEGKAFEVTGKIAGQEQKRVYEKGLFGRFNAVGDIAKDFGKKKAAWEATKSIGRGMGKFEGLEGAQELLQNASDQGIEDYYYDLYHGSKGYGGEMDRVLSSIQNPITDAEGMKTFLMGALTGRLIAPMSAAFGGISTKIGDARKLKEDPNYKNGKERVKEAVGLLNHLYQDPAWFKKEALASIKVNNKAAETMEIAAANHNRYVFNNHKDSAFAKTVAAAIKLDMYDSLKGSIKEFGNNMDEKQFKEAFGIDLTEGNKGNVKQLTGEMIAQVDDYYNTFNILKDKYADLVVPELYKNNKGDAYKNARLAKAALNDAIELIATNSYKSKQVLKRASDLQTQIAANKNIGGSSMQVLTTMGSEQALAEHIQTLQDEIAVLKTPGATLTKEQKENLKDKEEELHLAKTWQLSYDEIMGNDSAEYSPTAEGRAYNSFSKLITLFNKRAKNYTAVSKEDVDDNFIKLTDYIKLNKDHGDYIDAMNLLADPYNIKLVTNSINSAIEGMRKRFQEEHKDELEKETGISTKEVPKHSIVKEEDGTFTIKSPDGSDAKTGIATEEEAKAEKEAMDAALAAELAAEEAKAKAAAAATKSQVITDPASVKVGDIIISDSGTMYEIRGILPDGKVQYLSIKDGGKGVWGKDQFEQYIKEGRFTRETAPENPPGPPPAPPAGTTTTVDDLIKEIEGIELTNDAYQVVANKYNAIKDDVTDEEYDKLTSALNKKADEVDAAIKAAAAAGSKKFYSDTDPEFLNLYIPATKKVAEALAKDNITEREVKAAFDELWKTALVKLDPAIRPEYVNKHNIEKEEILNKIRANNKANDIASVKAEITKALAGDDVSIDLTVESLFDILNIDLSPELKEEAIQHFETEYLKAIDRKIEKLNKLINDTGATPVLNHLLKTTDVFKQQVKNSIELSKKKADEVNLLRNGADFSAAEDYTYTNPVHRSIISSGEGDATEGQAEAIRSFENAGLLTDEDHNIYDETDKHGASRLINLAIGRSYTLQLNKAVRDFFKTNNPDEFRDILTKYYNDKNEKKTADEIKKEIDEFIEAKQDYEPTEVNEYIDENFKFPNLTTQIDNAQYKALSEYRSAIYKLMADANALDVISYFEKRQQQDLHRGGEFILKDCFKFDDAKKFDRFLESKKDVDVSIFHTAFLNTYEKVKQATTVKDANKLITELGNKYLAKNFKSKQPKSDAVSLLNKIFATLLQTESLLDSDADGSTPLSPEQIEIILEKPDQSLSRSQITQVEEFAKTEKLEKIKKKFAAAIGHSIEPITYNPVNGAINIDKITFSSLRQKYATDTRTSEELATKLMPDADGNISTKKALDFIVRSKYSTTAEKQLAQKLLGAAQDEDVIKVDNTIKDPGEYDQDTNEIFINLDKLGYKTDRPSAPIETVILHELMHSVIEKAIADPSSEYAKGIKELYNLVKVKEGAKTFYAYQEGMSENEKIREFVTEAFTNPAFQYLLATTPASKTSKESVWDRLMTFLSRILKKFGIDMDSTVLSEVMSLTNNLFDKNDILPSERIMEQVKTAATEEELNAIMDSLNKDDFGKDMYNSLLSAIRSKIDSINAVKIKELVSKMISFKVGKSTYYYTNDNGNLEVYKKVKYKLSKVRKAEVIAAAKEDIAKRNPPPPPPPPPAPEGGTAPYTIESDLLNKEFKEDIDALNFNKVSAALSKTAAEKNAFRSTNLDGFVDDDGNFVETAEFQKYYHKVRTIINKLSTLPLEKLAGRYVTIVKDQAGVRWDGSAQGSEWQNAIKKYPDGLVGYISDEDGNPIVYDKNGNEIGRAKKDNPADSRFNTGENQIVYFSIVKKDTGGNPEEYARMAAVREDAVKGTTYIAPLQKVSQGQMALKGLVSPISVNQKNTARDKDIQDMMLQDHVTLELNGAYLNAVIKDGTGAVNKTALFTPNSGAVKVKTPTGGTYSMIDHVIELMKVYQQMKADGDPNAEQVRDKVVTFARKIWLTGTTKQGIDRNLKIFSELKSLQIQRRDTKNKTRIPTVLSIFDDINGVMVPNEENIKRIKVFVDNMKINIDKNWLEAGTFEFPYITEIDGKKSINFDTKSYRDFLVKDVGLITYINDIPVQKDIRRYSSIVHFLDPKPLDSKPSGVGQVTQKDLVNNPDAIEQAVDDAAKTGTSTGTKKVVRKTTGGRRRLSAVAFQTQENKNYEKICK